jgi:hypothetical protein
MSEKQMLKEKVKPIKKLIEDDEYKLLLSSLKKKAKIDTKGEEPYVLLNENFGGSF